MAPHITAWAEDGADALPVKVEPLPTWSVWLAGSTDVLDVEVVTRPVYLTVVTAEPVRLYFGVSGPTSRHPEPRSRVTRCAAKQGDDGASESVPVGRVQEVWSSYLGE